MAQLDEMVRRPAPDAPVRSRVEQRSPASDAVVCCGLRDWRSDRVRPAAFLRSARRRLPFLLEPAQMTVDFRIVEHPSPRQEHSDAPVGDSSPRSPLEWHSRSRRQESAAYAWGAMRLWAENSARGRAHGESAMSAVGRPRGRGGSLGWQAPSQVRLAKLRAGLQQGSPAPWRQSPPLDGLSLCAETPLQLQPSYAAARSPLGPQPALKRAVPLRCANVRGPLLPREARAAAWSQLLW